MMTLKKVLAGCAMLSLTAVPFALCAQQQFKIEGQMGKDQKGMLKLRYTSVDKDVEDSIKVTDGSFRLNGVLAEPSLGMLIFMPDDTSVNGQYKEIFIDPAATITMKGEGNLTTLQAKGGPSESDFQELVAKFKPLAEKGPGLEKQFKAYQEAGDDDNTKRIGMELQQLRIQRREIQQEFAKTHLNSFVGYSLWARFQPEFIKDPAATEAEFNKYSAAIRNTPSGKSWVKRFAEAKKLDVGKMAPDFQLTDDAGKQVSLSSLKGKNVLLCFWNHFFIPFEPFGFGINKISRQCKDENLVLVLVYCDKDNALWQTTMEENGFKAPNIINLIYPVKLTGEVTDIPVAKAYNLSMGIMPHSYLIGTDGKILVRNINFMGDPVEEIKKSIKK